MVTHWHGVALHSRRLHCSCRRAMSKSFSAAARIFGMDEEEARGRIGITTCHQTIYLSKFDSNVVYASEKNKRHWGDFPYIYYYRFWLRITREIDRCMYGNFG